jgi:pimeloyl-ACP methyl ester carboxylesterase
MIKYIVAYLAVALSVFTLRAQEIQSVEVSFSSKDKAVNFGGTLTLPSNKKNLPAIIIVSGSGQQDRDGTMGGVKIFVQLANYLNAQGYAVLRTDDRGLGATSGKYEEATTQHFADDALAAFNFLKQRKEINPKKIGMMGHSEGGMAIAIAAAKEPKVAFLISLSGLATNGLEALIQQNRDIVEASTLPDYDKKRSNDINERMFATAYKYADSGNMEQKLNNVYNSWKANDDIYFKTLKIEFDHFRFPVYSYVNFATKPWYRYFIRYDAQKTLSKIKVPVLAINGDKDLMVAGRKNLDNWSKYVKGGGNSNVETHLIPNVNHLLIPCTTCGPAEVPDIKSSVSNTVLLIIGEWLKQKK